VTVAAGILASKNSCVDSEVAGSYPDIPVARDDTMVMVNYLSNKGCESYHNESNNSSKIIIKPMVALALEGENDIVSEATCNGSEIAKAALNKSSTQFMEHDVVVASTNNEPLQEISRSGTVLFDGPNDATTVALVATSNGSQDVSVMTPDVCEIKCKMEVSLEDTPKPRVALFQERENDEPLVSQNVFDAQDTHENISKPRTALFKEGEEDEPWLIKIFLLVFHRADARI